MSLKKIAFALLATLIYNFSIAQERSALVVEDINQRILVSRTNFDQHVNDTGTIVMYICADNQGNVTQIQVLRNKSTIKDLQTLSAVANEALNIKFNAVQSALPQCGEMTFNFDKKPVRRTDIASASKLGQDKVIGSRPTPPSTNVETGDLGQRKILLRPKFDTNFVKQNGLAVIYICADKYGRVIKAEPVPSQSTIKDEQLLNELAEKIKLEMKFSPAKQPDCMYYKVRIEGVD